MMISGLTPMPALTVSDVAMITADSGNWNDTTITPMPTATAGVSDIPGRCRRGNTARGAEEDRRERRAATEGAETRALHARPLHRNRNSSAPIVHAPALSTRPES